MMTLVRKRSIIPILVFLMMSCIWAVILPANPSPTAELSISPAQSSLAASSSLTVNVTLTNVVNLNAWQINVTFNPAMLAYYNMTVPSDDLLQSNVNGNSGLDVYFSNKVGWIDAFEGLDDPTLGISGSGTLCQITFNASQPGVSGVNFAQVNANPPIPGTTALLDNSQPSPKTIPFSAVGGDVTVTSSGFKNNAYQFTKNGTAYTVSFYTNSTVSNAIYNNTAGVIAFSLTDPAGSTGSCTTSIPEALMNGTFWIFVNGVHTPYSTSGDGANENPYLSYNQTTARINIFRPIPEDIGDYGIVNMKDIALVARAFGSTPSSPNWNPAADVNGDGVVNMKDVALVARDFGETYQPIY